LERDTEDRAARVRAVVTLSVAVVVVRERAVCFGSARARTSRPRREPPVLVRLSPPFFVSAAFA
jgi:hypothetical protein